MAKLFCLFLGLSSFGFCVAQTSEENDQTTVVFPLSFSISEDVSELAKKHPVNDIDENVLIKESQDNERRKPIPFLNTGEDGEKWGNDPLSIQNKMGSRTPAAVIKDWAGQYGSGYPPDPSGAAGINHYVQAVNHTPVKVFDKSTGNSLLQFSLGTLWSPPTANAGDPIVMYDKFADRWFIAQFDNYPSNKVYIAVSKTPNPTGQYYTWTFNAGTFPDYLKFSIWHDGYYMTINQIKTVFCFERPAMLSGSPSARMIKTNYTAHYAPSDILASFCPLTGDADGQLPTTGPCPMIYPVDNGWGAATDGIYLKELTVNWSGTPSMTVSNGSLISTSSHDMSSDPQGKDIDQPSGNKLDGIAGVPWFRAQYREWTGYNTLLCCFGVKIGTTHRAIKWVELRQTNGIWTKFQEGVFNPDNKSRWVASMAMDDFGNIGMSYARSSIATGDFPSCGFTGRLKNDAPGQMTIAETIVPGGTGTSSQSANSRFGDYSHTTIDPVDGCTFWSTVEYYAGTAPKTRIWSYQLISCSGTDLNSGKDEALSEYQISQSGNLLLINANKLVSDKKIQVDFFNISGKLISSQEVLPSSGTFNLSLNINNLSSGAYLLRIGNIDFQKVEKILIK